MDVMTHTHTLQNGQKPMESRYISAIGDNCLLRAFLPPDKSCTKAQVPRLGPPMPPASMELVPLPPNSSRIQKNDLYRGPGLYILNTTLLHVPLTRVPYPTSNSSFPSISSTTVCGFIGLPTPDLVSAFHATSLPFPMLLPGLRASIVTVSSSGVELKMLQTMHGAAHLLVSY